MAELTLDGTNLRIAESTEKSDSTQRIFPGSYWEERFSRAALKNKYELTAPSVAMEVQSKVKSLSETLASFRWPDQGFGLSSSRLVINDPLLDKNISASLIQKDDVQRYYRYYSRGFSGEVATSLDAGTYKFDMSLGSSSDSLEVEISSGMTNDQVLEAVRDAVNESPLHVQARIFKQNAVGSNPDDLLGTGSALALSVNTAYVVTEENRGDSTQSP